MIQRIQSLYLFLIALMGLTLLYLDPRLASYTGDTIVVKFAHITEMKDGTLTGSQTIYPAVISCFLVTMLSLFILFLYRKRHLQVKLLNVNYLFILGLLTSIAYYTFISINKSLLIIDRDPFWIFLPVSMMILNFLAALGVKKDIRLVSSADRIR